MSPVLTFAIGDIHGCQRALTGMLRRCRDYAKGESHRLVFIGDYIDRGPDSRSVIETLRWLEERSVGHSTASRVFTTDRSAGNLSSALRLLIPEAAAYRFSQRPDDIIEDR